MTQVTFLPITSIQLDLWPLSPPTSVILNLMLLTKNSYGSGMPWVPFLTLTMSCSMGRYPVWLILSIWSRKLKWSHSQSTSLSSSHSLFGGDIERVGGGELRPSRVALFDPRVSPQYSDCLQSDRDRVFQVSERSDVLPAGGRDSNVEPAMTRTLVCQTDNGI